MLAWKPSTAEQQTICGMLKCMKEKAIELLTVSEVRWPGHGVSLIEDAASNTDPAISTLGPTLMTLHIRVYVNALLYTRVYCMTLLQSHHCLVVS